MKYSPLIGPNFHPMRRLLKFKTLKVTSRPETLTRIAVDEVEALLKEKISRPLIGGRSRDMIGQRSRDLIG